MNNTLRSACIATLAATLLSGCLTVPNLPYQPGVQNTAMLLAGNYGGMQAGGFDAALGIENKRLNLRGTNSLSGSTRDGTFSTYLQDALQAELATAGLLEAGAPLVVSGTLLQNQLSAGTAEGHSVVSARFVVKRNGEPVYDRVLTARHEWASSFMAAIAVPTAFQNHVGTVQKLLGQLFADPDFKRATATDS